MPVISQSMGQILPEALDDYLAKEERAKISKGQNGL
jgi:hypothetical protein